MFVSGDKRRGGRPDGLEAKTQHKIASPSTAIACTSAQIRDMAAEASTLARRRSSVVERQQSQNKGAGGFVGHMFGIFEAKGSPDAMSEQWSSLSVVSGLLTGVAAAGLFVTAEFVGNFGAEEVPFKNTTSNVLTPDDTTPTTLDATSTFATFGFAKATMMAWCIDTFCFLNSTVLSCFFVAFQKRHCDVLVDVEMMIDALGWWAFHSPRIYFRTGYYLMVVSFSMFFMMVMSPFETLGCLAFCTALIIGPMFFFMNVSLATFNVTDEALKRAQTRRPNAVKL